MALAWPSILFAVLRHGYRIVDQFYAQYISVDAQAAIGSTTYFSILASGFFTIIAFGTAPLVGRAVGAGDWGKLKSIVNAALTGVLILSVVAMLFGTTSSGLIVQGLGLTGQTAAEAENYVFTLCLTMPPLVLAPLLDQSLIASGDTRTPMKAHALILAMNLILTPLFILGLDLGIIGAALSSTTSTAIGGIYALSRLFRLAPCSGNHDSTYNAAFYRADRYPDGLGSGGIRSHLLGDLGNDGLPSGTSCKRRLGIGFSALEGVTWPAFHGFSLAIASLVGRSLGAKRPDLAWVSIRKGLVIASTLGIIASCAFYFGQWTLTGFYRGQLSARDGSHLRGHHRLVSIGRRPRSDFGGCPEWSWCNRAIFWVLPHQPHANPIRVVLCD